MIERGVLMEKKMVPIGISNFEKLISEECYYVDKTNLIADLLKSKIEVILFSRPRRFGKTLNMNMLKEFLDIEKDSKELFRGLNIEKEVTLCEKCQNKYPVIFVSMKEIEGLDFKSAYESMNETILNLKNLNWSHCLIASLGVNSFPLTVPP